MSKVRWTAQAQALAKSDASDEEVAEATGRTVAAVTRYRRRVLGRGERVRRPKTPWTVVEDEAVMDATRTIAEIAASLGRSYAQVQGRRQRLRRGGSNHQPKRLGPPQGKPHWLLAKTCPECGLLRAREEFRPRGMGSANTACRECEPVAYYRALKDRQGGSLPEAVRWGQEWTSAEAVVALREDLSVAERAAMLGRTVYAVTAFIGRQGGRDRPRT